MNLEFYISKKYEESNTDEAVRMMDLYDFMANEELKYIFAVCHQQLNDLLKFLFSKAKGNHHYNASESRKLLNKINFIKDLEYTLKNTVHSFTLNVEYREFLIYCETFLQESNGSEIPLDLVPIRLLEYDPIFSLLKVVNVQSPDKTVKYPIHLIGEGSYAQVFKYKDEFYQKDVVIKRAKSDLTLKEQERFRREYEVMKELRSPYVIEVYRFDEEKMEYYMECADETLDKFISKNNNHLSFHERKVIGMQILRGFEYISSKEYLHRDISFSNILLFHYDDTRIVKISDFGLVKEKQSNLTSFGSEVKGPLNDSNLAVIGFSNYSIVYETFALTRLLLFVMTGKTNLDNVKDSKVKQFVLKGIAQNVSERYQNIRELKDAYLSAFRDATSF